MIITKDFSIRAIEEKDIDFLYKINTQEFRGDYQEFEFESKQSMRKQFDSGAFCSDKFKMLIAQKEDKILGIVYISFVRTGLVNIGLVMCENERGKNLGTSITKIIVNYIFSNYDIARIQADTDINNVAAQKVLEKAGFIKEGIMSKYRFHHGKYNDSVLYAITK